MENLTYSITGGLEVTDVTVIEGYNQPTARCQITTPDYGSLDLGDLVEVSIGYDSASGKVFEGYIQNIASDRLPGLHTLEMEDVLIKATEHMLVTDDLENPFSRTNIDAEDLVEDLLNEAGITDYTSGSPGFTFATGEVPAEFQLVFAWDAIQMVADVVAWHCYADTSGQVHFEDIDPVPGSSSKSYVTGSGGAILVANRSLSTDNLRNKVVVFGLPPIVAIASSSSPYLPGGFYKTAVISSHLIDTQSMADTTASYNLSKWNRLTESMSLEVPGDHNIHARDTVTVTESFTGATGDWFVFACTHSFNDTYTMRLNLVK